MEDKRQSFVVCECGTHAISVSSYLDETEHELYLSFWNFGWHGTEKMPWSYRLQTIWRILTRGYDHDDSVILSPTESQNLIEAIQYHLKK